MNETIAKIWIALLGTLLVVGSVTFILQPTGRELRCTTGWEFQEIGEFAGQYKCETATTLRHSYCSDVWDTKTGRTNYYCQEAIPVEVPAPIKEGNQITSKSIREACDFDKCRAL